MQRMKCECCLNGLSQYRNPDDLSDSREWVREPLLATLSSRLADSDNGLKCLKSNQK